RSRAAMGALAALCARAGGTVGDVDTFMHGTTIATNIILEHRGARVGLITTEGFRDLLHIARHKRPHNFSLQLDLPWQSYPLVERHDRLTVKERIVGPDGDVQVPLDEAAVREAARRLVAAGGEGIAICFMCAFINPVHEARAKAIVREEAPDLFVSTSHEVVPQYREYERFSTTCVNSFVGPKTARYLRRLAGALRDQGLRSELHLM